MQKHIPQANESDVVASAPPADLAAMLAKLDNISAEVSCIGTAARKTQYGGIHTRENKEFWKYT